MFFLVFPASIIYIKTSIKPIIVNNSVTLNASLTIPSNVLNSSVSNNYGLNAYWYALNPFDNSSTILANFSYSYDQLNLNNVSTNRTDYSFNIYLNQNIWSSYLNNQIYCQMYPTYNGLESWVSFGYQPYYLGLYIDFIPYSSDIYLYYNFDYYTQSVHLVLLIFMMINFF